MSQPDDRALLEEAIRLGNLNAEQVIKTVNICRTLTTAIGRAIYLLDHGKISAGRQCLIDAINKSAKK